MRGLRLLRFGMQVGRAPPGTGIGRGMGTGSIQLQRMGRGADQEYGNGKINAQMPGSLKIAWKAIRGACCRILETQIQSNLLNFNLKICQSIHLLKKLYPVKIQIHLYCIHYSVNLPL